ncbi:unnamed protein product [Menidia menidia]|uniref:(Atlantic silverside) hypothetical protein n=1 Tax=Menidia menidia TaxID=238744 RepID=A0A8S4AKN3_9TELE|nr:unnamed protein product [Menidia menidia]
MAEMYNWKSEELTMMTFEQMNQPVVEECYMSLPFEHKLQAYKMYGNAEEMTEMELVEPSEVKPLLSKSSSTVEGDIAADGNPDPPQPDSDGWTKLQPEVVHTKASRAPTYSLVSEPGHFECSVSGLRWVCEQKSSFEYRFCSWDGHMERMESRQYSPAGPLMDITVTAGKLAEVQLPHWVCTEGVPDLLGNFAVLHMDGCGEVLEKVSGVTPTHVKLTEPSFTSLGSVIKSIFRVKINCSMLIYYQPETSYLKLRVYLIPQDPALQQNVHYEETASGYEAIKKPRPDRPLKINQGFTLTASTEAARIQPKKITLRYDSLDPNFYELFMENPSQTFILELQQTKSKNEAAVWSCEIRKDDYPKSGDVEGPSGGTTGDPTPADDEHFVDKHMAELIQRVTNTKPILDALLKKKVIQSEQYKAIRALPGSEDQVRELYCGPLRAARACKDIFCSLLRTNEPLLMAELSKRK